MVVVPLAVIPLLILGWLAYDQLRSTAVERYVLMLPSLLKLFSSYLRAYPDYTEIRFLLPDGYEDARTTLIPIPNITEEEGNTPFFQELSRFKGDAFVQVIHLLLMKTARFFSIMTPPSWASTYRRHC